MIKAEGLVKRYGKRKAVDDLSFEIRPGRVYGLLGVNGAGKSTTMNMITGYLAPSEGNVYVDGDDIFKKPEKAKVHIGYLPEQPPLYPDMTVREYLLFVAGLKKVRAKEREKELERVMSLARVEDVSGRLIKNLSKGYKQRVGLAQALISDPEVIILDEPTVGLDPRQIIEIRTLIRELGKKHAVVLSSHILSEVQAVCDEILIISKGSLVASGTPESLESMAGTGELKVLIKGTEKALKSLLSGIGSITGMKLTPGEEGCVLARITTDGTDIREELFYALAKERMPVMEMSMSKASLEDVFLELIENENAAGSEAEAADTEDGGTEESGAEAGTVDGTEAGGSESETETGPAAGEDEDEEAQG